MNSNLSIYYKLQLKIILRVLKELHVAILLIAAILCAIIVAVYHSNAVNRLLLVGVFLLLFNQKRTDKLFLENQYRKKARAIFICDSIILSIPFIVIHLLYNEFWYAPIPLLFDIAIPLLPRRRFNFAMPECFLFPKGAFEFQRIFRFCIIPYIILFVAGIMGTLYDNIHLIEVCTAIACIIPAMLLLQPPERSWVMNFCSVRQFLKIKAIQTLICGTIIMLPFLVLLLLGGLNILQTLIALLAYLFLLEQAEMLRFVFQDNEVLLSIIFLALLFVNYLSLGITPTFGLSLIILVTLMLMCRNKISDIVND